MTRFLTLAVLLLLQSPNFCQPIPNYYTRTNFLMAPPAAFADGLLGFANPANIALLAKPEARFYWSTDGSDAFSLEDWGVFTGIKHVGFAVQRQEFQGVGVTDFRITLGHGTRSFAVGLAYGWSAGKFDALGREKLFSGGTVLRPLRYVSFGLTGSFSLESSNWESVGEVGLRPLGTSGLTLFADAVIRKDVQLSDADWSAGATVQVVPGIDLVGRYFKSDAFTVGLRLNFGRTGLSTQGHFDSDANHAMNTQMVRAGGAKASVFPTLLHRAKRYLPLTMKGRVDYLKYQWLDAGTHPFLEILQNIQAAKDDPRVAALALNLSEMNVLPEHAWEIRQALKEVQRAGKKVVVYVDRPSMTPYHLASIADRIILDPEGFVLLQGYALGRTYLKGTLEKLGLGFDEWRFFKYKSANEFLSRDSMSEADREQLQDFVDDLYELVRQEVSTARHFAPEKFDEIVDDKVYILPHEAVRIGLVDTLARWSSIGDIVAQLSHRPLQPLAAGQLQANALPFQSWGTLPKIAVVYGLGVCALDEGIKARWLEPVLLSLARNPSVKAIVFRVDSPGGDGLASDLVAEALRECSKAKPVIVTQGQVAASGGYWISMYADSIFAGPNSITGSIGVISGWLYDKGFTRKLGMSSDLVKRGAHADLGRGVTLPYLGLTIPARNLTPEERAQAEVIIKEFYDGFVSKVAQGRKMSVERVRQIAEGRIYSGVDGKEVALVDRIGGLAAAIDLAKKMAGLRREAEVQIVQIPRSKGLINLKEKLLPVGISVGEQPVLQFIKMMSAKPGQPLPLLLPGTYPALE
ncbi:MAG: signal peptide peptidase SppA [bacterium]